VIYFHTKGASKAVNSTEYMYDHHWRKAMEHFVLDLHRTILTTDLNDTSAYATAGAFFMPRHYATWWPKYPYFAGSPPVTCAVTSDRHMPDIYQVLR
jgi:hypothetical protein